MDNIYVKGSTSIIVQVLLRDSQTAQGKTGLTYSTVTAYYCRPGGTSTAISLIAGSPGDTYVSGKFAEVDSTNMPGLYQVHLPIGCLATGANSVVIYYSASGVITAQQKIILNDADLRNATNLGLSDLLETRRLSTNKQVWEYTGGAYTGKVFVRNDTDSTNYAYTYARNPITLAVITDPNYKGPMNFDAWTLI